MALETCDGQSCHTFLVLLVQVSASFNQFCGAFSETFLTGYVESGLPFIVLGAHVFHDFLDQHLKTYGPVKFAGVVERVLLVPISDAHVSPFLN